MKRTPKIDENLKKRKLIDGEGGADECEFAFMTMASSGLLSRWFVDSCASRHLTNHRENMFHYRSLSDTEYVKAACERGSIKVVGIH